MQSRSDFAADLVRNVASEMKHSLSDTRSPEQDLRIPIGIDFLISVWLFESNEMIRGILTLVHRSSRRVPAVALSQGETGSGPQHGRSRASTLRPAAPCPSKAASFEIGPKPSGSYYLSKSSHLSSLCGQAAQEVKSSRDRESVSS